MSINLAMYKYKETYLNHPSYQGAGFLIQGSRIQNHWVGEPQWGGGGGVLPPSYNFF